MQSHQFIQHQVLQNSVVVFSKNYMPVSRVNLKRAIVLLVTGQAEPFDFSNTHYWEVRSPNLILQVPECIRLTVSNPAHHWKVPPVSRREVFRRDNHTCQYCGSTKQLTIDHVIPRSKGGPHIWSNVVAACETCNSKKGNLTPAQANMPLLTKPKAPVHPAIAFSEQFWQSHASAK